MEARAAYGPWRERPRLTVVHDGGATYSALPHVVMRDTSLPAAARLLYAVLQGYAWQGGECRASHETMAGEIGCSTRMLRTYLDKLIGAGLVTEHDAGYRRQKVYRLVSIGSPVPIETVNEQPGSDSEGVSRKFPTVQSEISDTFNRKPASDSKKKTPEKKTLEEDLSIPAESPERMLFDYYRSKIQPAARVNAPEKIRTRLKRFTVEELKAGIDHFAADAWWMENNAARGAAWFFDSDKRSEQFLNLTLRPKPRTNGSGPVPPKQSVLEGWAGFKGRYGGNIIKTSHDDGR